MLILAEGCLWTTTTANKGKNTHLDGGEPQVKEEVPHCTSRLVIRWYVEVHFGKPIWMVFWGGFLTLIFICVTVEFLQERLTQETSRPVFSQLPFRFAEVAKILLDV